MYLIVKTTDGEKSYELPGAGKVTIGRDPGNTIVLQDRRASSSHAEVAPLEDGRFRLKDLGSSNGVIVNGTQVAERVLAEGDIVKIGDTLLVASARPVRDGGSRDGGSREGGSREGGSREGGSLEGPLSPKQAELARLELEDQQLSGREVVQESFDDFACRRQAPVAGLKRLNTLYLIGQETGRLRAGQDPFAAVLKLLGEEVKADRALLFLYDEVGEKLAARSLWTAVSGQAGALRVSKTILVKALREKTALLVADTSQDALLAGKQSIVTGRISSSICVPLSGQQQRIFGVLFLDIFDASRHFTREDLDFASLVAHQIGWGLENAQLTRQLEQKNRELQQHLEALKQLDHAKDEFIALISHELRTPLSLIAAYTGFLQDPGTAPDLREESLGYIEESGRKLIEVTDRLVTMMALMNGRQACAPVRTDLFEVAAATVDCLGTAGATKKVETVSRLRAGEFVVMADSELFPQVLHLVLDNAIRFNKAGGRVEMSATRNGDRVALAVADTGSGISAEEMPRLFQRFVCGGDMEHHQEGIGMSLALCREILKLHQGRIWAESPGKDQGSTFYIELPAAPA